MVLSRCEHPLIITDKNGNKRSVPCGKCVCCQSIKKYQWKKRLDNEFLYHKYGLAFTLTYSDDFLPCVFIDPKTSQYWFSGYDYPVEHRGLSTDIIDDLQNYYNFDSNGIYHIPCFNRFHLNQFFKSLKNYAKNIRYYIQTELGPTTLRPHAHGVLFFNEYSPEFVKSLILQAWSFCDWSISTNESSIHLVDNASYCTSYVSSTVVLPKLFQFGKFRPFSVKSTGLPIGSQIFDNFVAPDFKYQEKTTIPSYNTRKFEYEFLPFLRYHEARYFPRLPYSDLYSVGTREFLYKSYHFFKNLYDSKILCGKFTYSKYEEAFNRFIEVNSVFAGEVKLCLTSPSSIYRIYLTSKKFCESWQHVHPLLRDFVFDRYFYNYEMSRLREQYQYEESWCNDRHLDPRYLIYKDVVFVNQYKNEFGFVPLYVEQIVRNFGYRDFDDFTASVSKFSLDYNKDVQIYLSKVKEFSRLSHKSHSKNDYFEKKSKFIPYLKHGLT